MDVFTYAYNCSRWYGAVSGTRNIYVEGEVTPIKAATEDAKRFTGSKTCDIRLLQRYKMIVSDVETFPAMATQPLFKCSDSNSRSL